jgi:hypothetical protein
MPEQTYKSPNFYDREVDLSAPRRGGPTGVPAGVVGTSNKGPAFVPVTVANFDEFATTFGDLDPKQYGPYAAKEFLKNRQALTYVRVLGAGANSTDAHLSNTTSYGVVNNAGFTLSGSTVASDDKRSPGVVQFLVAKHVKAANAAVSSPTFEDNDTTGASTSFPLVRGLLMTPNTARIMVMSSSTALGAISPSTLDSTSVDADTKFKIVISSSLGAGFATTDGVAGLRVLTASFDPTSKDYFAKVLNRDPDKFYTDQHYLHGDFAVDVNVAYVSASCPVGVVSGSSGTSANGDTSKYFREVFGAFNTRYTAPKTSYFISQPFGKTEYDLFRVEALDDGEYANALYKVSISNVRASTNDANKFGTFNLQIRSWDDTDTTPIVLEQFSNCSLDPTSPNYVARLVGDRKVYFNFDAINSDERRIVASGKYENQSRYVRVIMNPDVENGLVPSNALPFGFRGPEVLRTNPNQSAASALASGASRLGIVSDSTGLFLTASMLPPVPHRFKVTRGELTGSMVFAGEPGPSEQANVAYYWGVHFERASTSSDPTSEDVLNANVTNEKNPLIETLTKFCGIRQLDALVTGSAADTLHNNKFSLSKVALYNTSFDHLTSSVNTHMREAAYIRNATLDSTDYTYSESSRRRITFGTLLSSGSAPLFNRFSSYMKFTNFMYGGFDGVNYLNRDARRLNDKSVSFDAGGGASTSNTISGFATNPSGQDVENNGVASYLTAINIVTNPLESNCNIIALPGIREPYVVDQASRKVRDYGMALFVCDIPSYDDNGSRIYDDTSARPSVNQTANQFDSRAIDNNFVATYFSDVYIDDDKNKRRVKVPASVAVMGALSFNDRFSYPWFAPAGFNRAALDFVKNVVVRLSVPDRDRLSNSRINSIATFPNLGYVIYDQKTLQLKKSALDRVNVRRLLNEVKRIVIDIAKRLTFENNTAARRDKFVKDASFQLSLIQVQSGIEQFVVIMDSRNNTQEDYDLNRLNGKIGIVPTRTFENIAVDFIITNNGVDFV